MNTTTSINKRSDVDKNDNVRKICRLCLFMSCVISIYMVLITSFIYAYYVNSCSDIKCDHINGNSINTVKRFTQNNYNIVPEIYNFDKCTKFKYVNCTTVTYHSIMSHDNETFYNTRNLSSNNSITHRSLRATGHYVAPKTKTVCDKLCQETTTYYRGVFLFVETNTYNAIINKHHDCSQNYTNMNNCFQLYNQTIGANENVNYQCKIYETINTNINTIIQEMEKIILLNIDVSNYAKWFKYNSYYGQKILSNECVHLKHIEKNTINYIYYQNLLIIMSYILAGVVFAIIIYYIVNVDYYINKNLNEVIKRDFI